jgi:hypothetical protein
MAVSARATAIAGNPLRAQAAQWSQAPPEPSPPGATGTTLAPAAVQITSGPKMLVWGSDDVEGASMSAAWPSSAMTASQVPAHPCRRRPFMPRR